MKAYTFIDRFFDLICISLGTICILVSSFLHHNWWVAIGIGGMLVIISGSNFLNPHCRAKLLGHGVKQS